MLFANVSPGLLAVMMLLLVGVVSCVLVVVLRVEGDELREEAARVPVPIHPTRANRR